MIEAAGIPPGGRVLEVGAGQRLRGRGNGDQEGAGVAPGQRRAAVPRHRVGRFLLDLREGRHEALRKRLMEPRLERFIGVIYRPETELQSHYAEVVLPEQFDAWAWFDQTTAVSPLTPERHGSGMPETWPFGL